MEAIVFSGIVYSVICMVLISAIFLVPAIIGRFRKVKYPIRFGFICGSINLGIQGIIAGFAIPFIIFSIFVLPSYYENDQLLFLLFVEEYFEGYFYYFDAAIVAILTLVIPLLKLSKNNWTAYEVGIDANKINKADDR